MFSNLEKLYLKRLKFNSKRLKLLERVRGKGYLRSIGSLVKIRVILQKEIIVNKKIISVLEKGVIEEEFLEQIILNFRKINSLLVLEEKLISDLDSLQVFLSYFKFVYGKQDSYTVVWNKVKNLSRQEAMLNQEIINLSSKFPKGFQIDKSKFRQSWQLIIELQKKFLT